MVGAMTTIPHSTNLLSRGREREVRELLEDVAEWATAQSNVRAVALAGSWTRGTAREDSDVDIVVLTDTPSRYVDGEDWLSAFGTEAVVRTQQRGNLT